MKKLRLEELGVESFSTSPRWQPGGTVVGNQISDYGTCYTWGGCGATCGVSCGGTCPTCPVGSAYFTCACMTADCAELTNSCRERGTYCNPVECPPPEQ